MRALIIDPSLAVQSILNEHLLGLGTETVLCSSGKDAVTAIDEQTPDIVCLAMHLEDMSGIELALRIRARPNCFHIPLIMLTTEENRET
ncbi:MAG: response regulator, partial [Pseudomonadales bacterium]|nr:response regulator [Pseudomonadales bacterium]